MEYILQKLVDLERYETGEHPLPTMLIVDSKTVQNSDTAGEKGYDAGKKSGIKIHIAVDVLGLPYSSCVTPAHVGDRAGVVLMFSSTHFYLPTLSCILGDGGYIGSAFADRMVHLTGARIAVAKRSVLHRFAVMPKRWIVERSFAWLDKCRRLWKNCERKLENTMNMVRFAFISILLRRL